MYRHVRALEVRHNEQARAAKRPLPNTFKVNKLYVPTAISDLAKLPPVEQANRAREMIAQMRNDPKSAYNDERHLGHAQAKHEMRLLYQAQSYGDGSAVLDDETK